MSIDSFNPYVHHNVFLQYIDKFKIHLFVRIFKPTSDVGAIEQTTKNWWCHP